ncbi:MAG: hypothetical protein DSZ11_05330 [Sulfurovum sp.]|nr:MAG: hypothetical protein DSZ11_05330 [Sulfurovum sp.]
MKIYNGENNQERRRKHYITPIIYFLSELSFIWIILSVIEIGFNIGEWRAWAIVALFVGAIYPAYKTINIFRRQKNYKRGY